MKILLATLVVLSMVAVVPAADRYWTGLGANDDWTTPENWDGDTMPGDEPCFIEHVGNHDPVVRSAVSCYMASLGDSGSALVTLTIESGGSLTTNSAGYINVGNSAGTSGKIDLDGSLSTKYIYLGRSGQGELNIVDGATLTLTERMRTGEQASNGGSVVNMTGGTITMNTNDGYSEYIAVGYQTSSVTSRFNMSGGTINIDGSGSYITLAHAATGSAGCFDLSGGTINTPTFVVSRLGVGTLNVSGTGVLNIDSKIRLGEQPGHAGGTVHMTGGTINATGTSYIAVGYEAGAASLFDLSDGTVNTPTFVVGRIGPGTLDLSGTGVLNTDAVNIGEKATHGDSILNMTGGHLDCVGPISIGYGADVSHASELRVSGGLLEAVDLAVARDGKGKLSILGSAATIDVDALFVGGYLDWGGPGTLEYLIDDIGVTPIQAGAVTLQAPNTAVTDSVSDLVISLTAAPPAGNIVLVDNQGEDAVVDVFDSLNGGSAAEGATVVLNYGGVDYTYTLTYQGIAGSDGIGNDIMLVPEPSVVMLILLGLGMIAASRGKR